MRAIRIRVSPDELTPRVVWSDGLPVWASDPASVGVASYGGNRWVTPSSVVDAGTGMLYRDGVVPVDGADWIYCDPLSTSGLIIAVASEGEGETPDIAMLPGDVISISDMRSMRVVASPEQSDISDVRLMIGAGDCPIRSGHRPPTGQPMPVVLQRRVSGDSESFRVFGGTAIFAAGSAMPVAKTLGTWSGRRFGGGRVAVVQPPQSVVVMLVGPTGTPNPVGMSIATAVNGSNDTGLAGYAVVGVAPNGLSTAAQGQFDLVDDPGVYIGYPGSMGLHAIVVTAAATAVSAITLVGSYRLRAEGE